MGLHEMFQRFTDRLRMARQPRVRLPRPLGVKPMVERMEDRTLLSTLSATSILDLSGHVQAANQVGGWNTSTLAALPMVASIHGGHRGDGGGPGPTGL
jgi:hypothetical protein